MTSRREAAHVGTNLGEEVLDRGLAQARNLLQSCNGVTKGLKRGLDPPIEGRDRLFQLLNGLQVLLDEEAVMWAHATEQRIGKLRLRCGEPRTAKHGQHALGVLHDLARELLPGPSDRALPGWAGAARSSRGSDHAPAGQKSRS